MGAETVREGVSAIIYDSNGALFFLILKREKDWKGWEFCKGGLHEGENVLDALKREIKEETGIAQYKVLGRLKQKREFVHNDLKYSFDVFLVQANMNTPVSIDHNRDREHSTYLWAKKDQVMERLHWDNEKSLFMECLRYLETQK